MSQVRVSELLASQVAPNPIFPVSWLQGPPMHFDFNKPQSYFFFGNPDTGKSTAMINVLTNFLFEGHKGIDIAGAEAAAEELIWFFTPYADRTIMIHGDDVDVETKFAKVPLSKFNFELFNDYDMAVTTRGLYGDSDAGRLAYYSALFKIFNLCQNRRGWKRHGGRVIALAIREAWNIIYSQIEAGISKDEQAAQRELKRMNKERFHTGIAPLLDSQRYMEIDTSVRQLTNFRIIKGFGGQVIPDEFDFLFRPHLFGAKDPLGRWKHPPLDNGPWKLRNLPIDEFIMLTSSNGVATGLVSKAPWNSHKGEYLLEELGIIVHPKEKPGQDEKQGTPKVAMTEESALKKEHEEMWKLHEEGLSYVQIAERMNLPDRPMKWNKVRFHLGNMCSSSCYRPIVTVVARGNPLAPSITTS